VIEKYN